MKPRLHLLLIAAFAWIIAATNGLQVGAQRAWAQPPNGSSQSDNGREHERDRSRRFGDRVRSSRSRGEDEHRSEERRSEERSSSSGGSGTTSSSASSSSRPSTSSSPAPSTGTSTSTSASSSGSNLDLKKWATALVAKNDKNGDMILQPDEQAALGSSAASEDLDHDGKITIDEIVMHHSAPATAASQQASGGTSTSSTTSDSGRRGDHDRDHSKGGDGRSKTDDALAKRVLTGSAGGTSKDADKRHSYRFSRAADKLPSGLPSWFKSRDANGDGQVSMSEYSRSVSQSMVTEFRRYDANDDGIITAKEAAKQK